MKNDDKKIHWTDNFETNNNFNFWDSKMLVHIHNIKHKLLNQAYF